MRALLAACLLVGAMAPNAMAGIIQDSSLVLWFDAGDVNNNGGVTNPANGAEVLTWSDKSGSARNATNVLDAGANTPNYQTNALNGQPALQFLTKPDVLATDTINASVMAGANRNTSTIFQVTKFNSGVVWLKWETSTGNQNNRIGFEPVGNNARMDFPNDGSGKLNGTTPIVGNYHLITGVKAPANEALFVDASLNASNSTAGLALSIQSNRVHIGAPEANRSGNGAIVDFAEILFYNRVLNAPEVVLTNNYLSAKYNLADSTSKYAGDDPGNGDYDHGVFGIGQDGAVSGTGIGAGTVNGTNGGFGLKLTAINNTLDDTDYLLAGDQGTANTLVQTLLPTGVSDRWSRVFYVYKTGSIDAELAFQWIGSGLTYDALASYRLLYSSTDNATFTLTGFTPTISNSTQVTFDLSNADLPDGYYTLAIAAVPEPSSLAMLLCGALALWFVRSSNW